MRILLAVSLVSTMFVCQSSINNDVPPKNQDFIKYLEENGKSVAPTYQTANCVQFMDKILTSYSNIDEKTSERIYIKCDIEQVKKYLQRGDSTVVSGVCWALVASGKAKWIARKDAKIGDIVQYWSTDYGMINGHCGVICGEDSTGYLLYSSHQDSKGFGIMQVKNKTTFPNTKFFIVRLN